MLLVIADTSPLRYLVAIGSIDLLPSLFGRIHIPQTVHRELCHASAPATVRAWADTPPAWVQVVPDPEGDTPPDHLDAGERAVLALAASLQAGLILIDDRKGAAAARERGFTPIGTLGLLVRAASKGLIELAPALERLEQTNFRRPKALLEEVRLRFPKI